ncbi:precorrin-3B synthase [Synechococcus sp. PCC 7502]|uniref:precorrin-3B synthase n=1 Tax=Synechococcus sp. PCC 7502 TaxID=1173263 RepID=UPI00029FC1B0|nr:precorrin-3B synthase [Synechococcus sp. PCC 7502]AFY74132.1 precorrin-3B synthase [Synechococcus sp. PCC 7502]
MNTNLCPSLFKPTTAVDGVLTRIRIPFGILSYEQVEAIALTSDSIHITNRANIQIRTTEPLSDLVLKDFQKLGLAAPNPDLDHLRNIMISPTAGIDTQALLDTRPLAIAWQEYIDTHPELAILSPKFSLGIDGGEAVSITNQRNDICLQAITYNQQIYFSLHLVNFFTGILISPEHTLDVLKVLTEIYRNFTLQKSFQKFDQKLPRLRDLIDEWGITAYVNTLQELLGYELEKLDELRENLENYYQHLGIHNQKQSEYSYMGIVLPLGRLSSKQFRSLGKISKSLRLTPFQNLIIPNIPNEKLDEVKTQILELGLSISKNHPYAGMVACSGITGCKSSLTDTQTDGRAIASYLEKSITLDRPLSIHLTGCEKSCAYHQTSDITLLGIDIDTYEVFVGDRNRELGRYQKSELPNLISELIDNYQLDPKNGDRSFKTFVNSSMIAQNSDLFDPRIRRHK